MTRTIVMMFLATLHARGALVAVDTLSLAQAGKAYLTFKKISSLGCLIIHMRFVSTEYGLKANTIDESLTQIMMCAEV